MQQHIGTGEAKTHFPQIIEEVESGTDFIITKRGKPVAKLIPFAPEKGMSWPELLERFRELRKLYRGKPGDFNTKEAIEEGRR
jgi:prevent-host-death family protein